MIGITTLKEIHKHGWTFASLFICLHFYLVLLSTVSDINMNFSLIMFLAGGRTSHVMVGGDDARQPRVLTADLNINPTVKHSV